MADEPVLPSAKIHFVGKLVPAGPILQYEIVLLSLPVVVPVLKKIFPPLVASVIVADPKIEQFVIVLPVASATNLIVEVPEVAAVLKLEMINEFPPVFKPLMVTLSAPLKLINGAPPTVPEMVLAAPPLGWIVKVYPLPPYSVHWFREVAPFSSKMSLVTLMVTFPARPEELILANKPSTFVNEV